MMKNKLSKLILGASLIFSGMSLGSCILSGMLTPVRSADKLLECLTKVGQFCKENKDSNYSIVIRKNFSFDENTVYKMEEFSKEYCQNGRIFIDGKNHTISGFKCEGENASLFKDSKLEIKNLTIKNFKISGSGYIGTLTSQGPNGCSFTNVHVVDSEVIVNEGEHGTAGGIAGKMFGFSPSYGSNDDNKTVDFEDCTVENTKIEADKNSGGLIGEYDFARKVINCKNVNSTITSRTNSNEYGAGGLIGLAKMGYLSSTPPTPLLDVQKCSNNGKVTSLACAGGIVGHIDCNTWQASDIVDALIPAVYGVASVKDSTNNGEILCGVHGGGIVGSIHYPHEKALLDNCENNGKIDGEFVGGILGYSDTNVTISRCLNNADSIIKGRNSGGIVGDCEKATITGCKNAGTTYGVCGIAYSALAIRSCEVSGTLHPYEEADSRGVTIFLGKYKNGITVDNSEFTGVVEAQSSHVNLVYQDVVGYEDFLGIEGVNLKGVIRYASAIYLMHYVNFHCTNSNDPYHLHVKLTPDKFNLSCYGDSEPALAYTYTAEKSATSKNNKLSLCNATVTYNAFAITYNEQKITCNTPSITSANGEVVSFQ